MKYRILIPILVFSIILQSCQPLSTIQVETIIPAEINFPGNFNKVVFINLATDINHDEETDTLLYNIMTQEMSFGFMDAIQSSAGIDSTNFLFVKGYPRKDKLYIRDTVSWQYLEKISGNSNSDIFIVLDSLNLSMTNEVSKDMYYQPVQYYAYREVSISMYWSVFDLVAKKRLDKYHYIDTLFWDAESYYKPELEDKMPSVEKSIRETCYFAAIDYANRIFPTWKTEARYYFKLGNKDFEKADQYVQENDFEKAAELWKNYTNVIDKEIASRACYNMAFASEMMGKLDLAIAWAEKSKKIKNKQRTRYYISILKSRQEGLKKLQKQIY